MPLLHCHLVHIFPTVSLFVIYRTTTRLVVKESHWKGINIMTFVYGYFNYTGSKLVGHPLYGDLLDWDTNICYVRVFLIGIFVTYLWVWVA